MFTGGGTAGHIMPIVAIGRELRRLYLGEDLKLYYIGQEDDLAIALLRQENFRIKIITTGKVRRYFSFKNFVDILFKIPFGFLQSFFIVLFMRPNLLFSKGGPGAAVVCLCAKILGVPVFIHESDVAPGLSNRISSRWAKKIFISFEKTKYFDLSKTKFVGHPIKTELTEGDIEKAKEMFNLTLEKPIVMFLGGSQGAEAINDLVLLIINDVLKEYEIIHITGPKNLKEIEIESRILIQKELTKYYHIKGYLNEAELKHALKAAVLVVSRAGSGSIFEIAACGKPSVLIPLPSSASDHQLRNASEYSSSGAAVVIEQENLTPSFFSGRINYLIFNDREMEKMKQAALKFAKPLAAKAVAREILEYLS